MGFADAGLPPELVPLNQRWLSGLAALLHWLTPGNGFAAPHAIESYRCHLGEEVQEAFPSSVYIDALSGAIDIAASES
jgi:hypothetical protein